MHAQAPLCKFVSKVGGCSFCCSIEYCWDESWFLTVPSLQWIDEENKWHFFWQFQWWLLALRWKLSTIVIPTEVASSYKSKPLTSLCLSIHKERWSSRTVLWAWRVVDWALPLELVRVWWYSDTPWGMKWDGNWPFPALLWNLGQLIRWLTIMVRSDSHCLLWDWQRVRSQDGLMPVWCVKLLKVGSSMLGRLLQQSSPLKQLFLQGSIWGKLECQLLTGVLAWTWYMYIVCECMPCSLICGFTRSLDR